MKHKKKNHKTNPTDYTKYIYIYIVYHKSQFHKKISEQRSYTDQYNYD